MKSKITVFLFASLFLFQFAYSQTIETIGMGVFNVNSTTLTFTDLDNIDHVVVEAIYKDNCSGGCGVAPSDPVTFSDDDETYDPNFAYVELLYTNNTTNYGTHASYFQATFNTIDDGGITLNQGVTNLGKIHSFIAYIYRNVENGYESEIIMDHALFVWNGINKPGVFTFPLDAVVDPRDLSVTIPLSELSPEPDMRMAIITVSAGGISVTDTLRNPDPALGNALNLEQITLVDVPGDATELTVSMYSPIEQWNIGDSWITGGLVLDIETPDIDCGPCDGQMTSLTLQYLGDDADVIRVYSKKVQPDKLIAEFFNVSQYDELFFEGTANQNKLGSKVRITIGNNNNYTEIHTSCSQPIEVGMIYDNLFLLTAGTSHEGGDLCDDGGTGGGGDCGPCDGQMTSLTLQYLGDDDDVTIKVYKDKVQPDKLIATFNNVNQFDEFSFVGTGNDNKLGAKVRLTIDNGAYTEIHTSCSQPIEVGMTYNNVFKLLAGTSKNGGDLCDDGGGGGGGDCGPCDGQMTSLTLQYLGDDDDVTIKVYKDKVQPNKLLATFNNVDQFDEFSFIGTGKDNKLGAKVRITIDGGDYTEIHTSCSQPIGVGMTYDDLYLLIAGTSKNGGELCEDGGSGGGGGDDCGPCDGQMTSLTLEYLGSPATIIKVYFDKVQPDKLIATFNNVTDGDELSFVGTKNHNKLGAKVRITIDGGSYTEIHTSCSQPIEVGMIYDNLFLLTAGTSHEGGDLCDDPNKSGTPFFEEMTVSSTYINVYPNPLVSGSTVEFEVANQGNTVVELINMQGQVVKQLYKGIAEPGSKYTILLSASDLNSGIYFLRMVNGNEIMNKKISVVR